MVEKAKVLSTETDSTGRRIVKGYLLGNTPETAFEAGPFGLDSNPVKNKIAIYAKGRENGKMFVVGYINIDQVAEVGETRLFSTDADGELKFHIWLHSDGTAEIGGNTDNAVRYSKLEEAFNELQGKFNDFVDAYVPGGPSSVGLPAVAERSEADITKAKIEEIKTI